MFIRGFFHAFLWHWERSKISYLCVCSDPTVRDGVDELVVRKSDLDFPVTTDVRSIMNEFRAARRGLISNAKCLTEGVDVPAVDMVAFLTPKRSRVDIVQATGRAMRKDPDKRAKTTGYILLPLFVEQAKGETVEEAIKRGGFDEVWNVLQAMQEQNDDLADIIRQMREQRGRTKGFDDNRFREKVERFCDCNASIA